MSLMYYFLIFMIYSFSGWCIEVLISIFGSAKKFVNRGFMVGPYCPIYGTGGLLITIFISGMMFNPFAVFSSTVVVCAILEYTISYAMEKIFHIRWWDYSDYKFNLNGRICLETLVLFGLGGLFVLYLGNPFLVKLFDSIPINILSTVSIILATIFIIDLVVSLKIILGFRNTTKTVLEDRTEEVSKKVKNVILDKMGNYKRILNAFPNVKKEIEKLLSNETIFSKTLRSIKNIGKKKTE